MTLLGKIFTMLIFIMSLVWMSFAVSVYMTHKNWMEVVTRDQAHTKAGEQLGLAIQLKNAKAEHKTLQDKLDRLQAELHHERSARAHVIAVLEEARAAEAALRKTAEDTHAQLLLANREATAAMSATQTRLDALKTEIADARTDIKNAQGDRDEKLERVVYLTDELHKAEDLLRRLQERQSELVAQISRQKRVLDAHGLNEFDDVDGIPPPLSGFVLAVNKQFLEISLGADDGVRVGHELEVFQDRTYKGRVVIRKTHPDRAVAEIIPLYRKGEIVKGDRVHTRTKVS
ncbi:MAG: hypothetical protein KDA71_03190 [Planctomycetales bacterium]|nr:hypothetical protein [Planctomycetales bacterium]